MMDLVSYIENVAPDQNIGLHKLVEVEGTSYDNCPHVVYVAQVFCGS